MKNIIFTVIIILSVVFYSCDSNSPNNDGNNPGGNSDKVVKDYFPGGIGSSWTYSIGITDSAGNTYNNNATKVNTFKSIDTTGGVDQIVQEGSLVYNGTNVPVREVDLRRTDKGLYVIIDTTGLSSEIPDSVKQLLMQYLGSAEIKIDTEVQTISVPFFEGQTWKVFALNIANAIDAISVEASYDGQEDISVIGENKTAEKIKYTVTFKYPSEKGFPLNSKTYNAYAWFVEGIGLVKFEGNALLTNVLSGSAIDISDTSRAAVQTLKEYTIK